MTNANPPVDADRNASRALRFAVLVVSFAAIISTMGCRGKALAPVRGEHLDAMTGFIKHQTCKPSSCTDLVCETFSTGQSNKRVPSYLVRCRWSDSTTTDSKRCAYAHYSVDAQEKIYTDLSLSSPAHSDTCAPDQKFNALLKKDIGYTGAVP
jgi:hypothetical protein